MAICLFIFVWGILFCQQCNTCWTASLTTDLEQHKSRATSSRSFQNSVVKWPTIFIQKRESSSFLSSGSKLRPFSDCRLASTGSLRCEQTVTKTNHRFFFFLLWKQFTADVNHRGLSKLLSSPVDAKCCYLMRGIWKQFTVGANHRGLSSFCQALLMQNAVIWCRAYGNSSQLALTIGA